MTRKIRQTPDDDLRRWELIHEQRHGGVLLAELGEAALRTIQAMTPDEKAHLRAKMNRSVGISPKSSNGKPS